MNNNCKICKKPLEGEPVPNADVYHMSCLMEKMKHVRERESIKKHREYREKQK